MSDFLRPKGWLKKAHLRLAEEPNVGAYGRVAALYDFAGNNLLPSARRELADAPAVPLRKLAEVWTPSLSSPHYAPDQWLESLQPGQELWASHPYLHTLGYPPIGLRLIPWILARHQLQGYLLPTVNLWTEDPWTRTGQRGTFMRQTLIYPDAKTGKPVDSVRWELLREGLEDFETLRLLRTAVDAAQGSNERNERLRAAMADAQKLLDEEVPRLVRSARDFTWDPAALEQIRTRAGRALSALTPAE
jgi:hypothetical protein